MTAPTLSEPWYTIGNVAFPDTTSATNIANSWVYLLKAFLLGNVHTGSLSGSRPTGSYWTIQGSSNGAATGYDGVDRWGTQFTASNYVHAASGTNHSWITLKSPEALGPVWMTIDLNSATTANMGITYSRTAPFWQGSLIGRPVSLYDWMMGSITVAPTTNTAVVLDVTTSVTHRAHFCTNSSGAFHFATSRDTAGLFNSYINCLNAVDTEATDLHPTWTGWHSITSGRGAPAYTTLVANANTTGRTHNSGSLNSTGGINSWSFGGTAFNAAATQDIITGQFRVLPIFIFTAVSTVNAWRGKLPDVWVIGNATVGGNYPSAAAPSHTVIGDLLVPMGITPIL